MGGKKKKKKSKKAKKEKAEGEEGDEPDPLHIVTLPEYHWIRLELKLCDPPTEKYNMFRVVMKTNDRIMEVKQKVTDYHGRVENMCIYNKDPYPPRNKKNDYRMEKKQRCPPFHALDHLLELQKEKQILDEQEERRRKRKAENPDQSDGEEEKKDDSEDKKKFEILSHFDFPTYTLRNETKHIVEFDRDETTLFEIFNEYGTVQRPKENPKYDPLPPPPKPKKEKVVKPPPEVVLDEEGNPIPQEEQKEEEEKEEEEEEFIPPLDRELYYDFRPHNGKEPILLALMIKNEGDKFTM